MAEPEVIIGPQLESDTSDEEDIFSSLDVLTAPDVTLQFTYIPSKFGTYALEEDTLSDEVKALLHGRAFVIDNESITETSSGSPRVYYLASDRVIGLVVPARSLSIDNDGPDDLYYRWTDDGEKWTAWITLNEGETHDYDTYEKCRFAEIQVYAYTSGAKLSLRATR